MQFNITFKTIFEYILKKLVLCIQIRFVSTEKNYAHRLTCILLPPIIIISLLYVLICKGRNYKRNLNLYTKHNYNIQTIVTIVSFFSGIFLFIYFIYLL